VARALSPSLDTLMVAKRRRPAWQVKVYDVVATAGATINEVVLEGLGLGTATAPVLDITDNVSEVDVSEVGGDYLDTGVASSTLKVTLSDPAGAFDPLGTGASNGWIKQGNVIVLREGDLGESDQTLWPITFTGKIVGQPGANRNRTTGKSQLVFKCQDRTAPFMSQEITSRDFGQGFQLQEMARTFALEDMGLGPDEIDFFGFGTVKTTCHSPTQFNESGPLTTLAQIMFVDGYLPRFRGDGVLSGTNGVISKGPTRTYPNDEIVVSIVRPIVERSAVTTVRLKGLDCDMEKNLQDEQDLAEANTTVGFMAKNQTIPTLWSEDGTMQALSTRMVVLSSVEDGPFAAGSESYSETLIDASTDAGSTRGAISVKSGLHLAIVIVIAIVWIASHFIPDLSVGFVAGSTLPVGRLIEGIIGQILFGILGTVGVGRYVIRGIPFEFIFKEVVGEAELEFFGVDALPVQDREEVEVENHLFNTQAECDAGAVRVLDREQAKVNLRDVAFSAPDLRLEPDDVFQTADERRYMIQSATRKLKRPDRAGEVPPARYKCFEVGGVFP